MLVLTRTVGDTIVLSNGVTIKVVGWDRGAIRLGVDAPEGVAIERGELIRKRQQAG